MKQTINNACGTIGLIHAIANNRDKMNFGKIFLVWFLLAFPFFSSAVGSHGGKGVFCTVFSKYKPFIKAKRVHFYLSLQN